jgi:outer membrane biosynthesis protein TonB
LTAHPVFANGEPALAEVAEDVEDDDDDAYATPEEELQSEEEETVAEARPPPPKARPKPAAVPPPPRPKPKSATVPAAAVKETNTTLSVIVRSAKDVPMLACLGLSLISHATRPSR